jgi:hypothetical protein
VRAAAALTRAEAAARWQPDAIAMASILIASAAAQLATATVSVTNERWFRKMNHLPSKYFK